MDYRFARNRTEMKRIDKLNALTNKETFWDDVRKLTKNVHSDHVIHSWECLSDQRYNELLTGVENVRVDYDAEKMKNGKIKFIKHYYDDAWNEVFEKN